MITSANDLRPEATAVPYDSLLGTQKEAYWRMAVLAAAAAIPRYQDETRRDSASTRLKIDLERKSRLAIVSGGRGTGKTTAVLSLIDDIENRRVPGEIPKLSSRSDEPSTATLETSLRSLFGRVVWLDILDMAPLPEGAKLFSAVLVRIEQAFKRLFRSSENEKRKGGILDDPELYDSPLRKLQDLQIDVAISWEGNLRQRPDTLDVNTFADEVRRTEFLRLELNHRLSQILEEMVVKLADSRRLEDPLFVLPVDDFDLNPPRCLELLELLRALSVPRLFFLILGDVDVAETLCGLQVAADVARVAGAASGSEFLPSHPHDLQATIANLGGNIIRKLLPPNHRVYLEPIRVEHALNLRPLGKTDADQTIGGLLIEIPLPRPWAAWQSSESRIRTILGNPQAASMHDFLFAKLNGEILFYHARRFLELPLRHLVDFWQMLEKTALAGGDDRTEFALFVKNLHYFCRDILRAEETLPPQARRNFRAAFDIESSPDWSIDPHPFELVSVNAPYRYVSPYPLRMGRLRNRANIVPYELSWTISARGWDGWEFQDLKESDGRTYALHRATADLIALYTDLVTLYRRTRVNPLLSLAQTQVRPMVHYTFNRRALPGIAWPFPPVLTFWETDLFLTAWRDLLALLTHRSESTPDVTPTLVFNWIRTGLDLIKCTPLSRFPENRSLRPSGSEWSNLFEDLISDEPEDNNSHSHDEPIRRWKAEVLSLINADVIGPDETPRRLAKKNPRLRAFGRHHGRRLVEFHEMWLSNTPEFSQLSPEEKANFWRYFTRVRVWWA